MKLKLCFIAMALSSAAYSSLVLAQDFLPEVESLTDKPEWAMENEQPVAPNQGLSEQPFYDEYSSNSTVYSDSAQPTIEYNDQYTQNPQSTQSPQNVEFNQSAQANPSFESPTYAENNAAGANPMLNMFKKMDALMQEVQELRGKVEEQQFIIQNLQENQKNIYLDIERRLKDGGEADSDLMTKIKGQEQDIKAPKPQTYPQQQRSPQSFQPTSQQNAIESFDFTSQHVPSNTAHEQQIYQKAYQSIQSKDYESALMDFKSLVKTYPQGQYSPNAYYWMGEIYLVLGELDLASRSFEEVYQEFPSHAKASDALLKLGYVEYAKGQWKRSKGYLNQVKSQFPGSTSARLADTRLQRMHQEGKI